MKSQAEVCSSSYFSVYGADRKSNETISFDMSGVTSAVPTDMYDPRFQSPGELVPTKTKDCLAPVVSCGRAVNLNG